jgi:hypothetical protein
MAENPMFTLPCRGSIALAAVVVVLLSSRAADAQCFAPGRHRQPCGCAEVLVRGNDLINGVKYDRVNQKLAVHRLQHLEAKLRSDSERGCPAAVNRDVRQIEYTRYRISMDEWLIRWNSQQDPCFVPAPLRLDCLSSAAIADATRPPGAPPILHP